MKKLFILIFLVIFMTSCAPSENTIQTAIAETLAAIPTNTMPPPTETLIVPTIEPTATKTVKPTATSKPTETVEPTLSVAELEQRLIDGAEALFGIMGGDDIDAINMIRMNGNIMEIELKTRWASKDSQPDVSYKIIQLLSTFAAPWDDPENMFRPILPHGFDINLVTYSTNGDYRYESFTAFSTLRSVQNKSISYSEWVDLSGAGFK